jgi:flagellar M-ring protein FliF
VKDKTGSNGKPVTRTTPELDQLAALVKTAVGFDSARGDQVTIVSAPFEATAGLLAESTGEKVLRTVQQVQRPALGLAALALVVVIALTMMKSLKSAAPSPQLAAATGATLGAGSAGVAQLPEQVAAPAPLPEPIKMPTNPLQQQIAATADAYPDVSAKILRNWIRNG